MEKIQVKARMGNKLGVVATPMKEITLAVMILTLIKAIKMTIMRMEPITLVIAGEATLRIWRLMRQMALAAILPTRNKMKKMAMMRIKTMKTISKTKKTKRLMMGQIKLKKIVMTKINLKYQLKLKFMLSKQAQMVFAWCNIMKAANLSNLQKRLVINLLAEVVTVLMALVVNDSLEKATTKLLKPKKLSLISKIMKVSQSITRSILNLKTRNSAMIS